MKNWALFFGVILGIVILNNIGADPRIWILFWLLIFVFYSLLVLGKIFFKQNKNRNEI